MPAGLPRSTAWGVAITAALVMVVSYVDRATFSVLAPTITKELDISDTAYGWLTSAFSIAYLVSVPAAGWWIDRAGARRGLAGSVLVWSGVAALHALVPGFATLFVLRIALGVAEGPGFPGAAQTVSRALPPRDHPRGYGMLFSGSSVGGMIAPLLATWLFAITDSWRSAFLGTAVVGVAWVPLWLAVTGRRDVRVQLEDAADLATEPRMPVLAMVGHPLMVRGLLAILAVAPIFGFVLQWGAKLLASDHHVTQEQMAAYLWLPPLLLDLGALGFGDLAARLRRAPGAPPRMLFAIAAALACTIGLVPVASTPWLAVVVIAIALGGAAGVYALVTADLLGRTPAGSVSLAGGVLSCAQSVALIASGPLIGRSIDAYGSYDVAAVALALTVVPGAIAWLAWPPAPRMRTMSARA